MRSSNGFHRQTEQADRVEAMIPKPSSAENLVLVQEAEKALSFAKLHSTTAAQSRLGVECHDVVACMWVRKRYA